MIPGYKEIDGRFFSEDGTEVSIFDILNKPISDDASWEEWVARDALQQKYMPNTWTDFHSSLPQSAQLAGVTGQKSIGYDESMQDMLNGEDPTLRDAVTQYGPEAWGTKDGYNTMSEEAKTGIGKALGEYQDLGFFGADGPWQAYAKSVGAAMGLSSLANMGISAATNAGYAGASSFAPSVPYQSLGSTLYGGTSVLGDAAGAVGSVPDSYWNMYADSGQIMNDGGTSMFPDPTQDQLDALMRQELFPDPSQGQLDSLLRQELFPDPTQEQLNQLLRQELFPDPTAEQLRKINSQENSLWGNLGSKLGSSALGKLFTGKGSGDDYMKALGILGSTGLGVYGANKQADAFKETADKYMALGAPFRQKLEASYAPGFDLSKTDPAYQGAMDQSANSVLKGLSVTKGNPFDNPGAVMEANKYVTQNTALPQLNTYRSQLGSFGQLGTNTAGTASLGGAQTAGGSADALGYGLNAITGNNNNKAFEDLMKKFSLNLGSRL